MVTALFFSSYALKEEAECNYSAEVTRRCRGSLPPVHPSCCRRPPARCRITYTIQGDWESEIDERPTSRNCRSLCNKHSEKCLAKCRCISERESIRDGEFCKCVPVNLSTLSKACTTACGSAASSCRRNCARGGPCAFARTSVNLSVRVNGGCDRITCLPPVLVPAPRICSRFTDTTPPS